MARFTKSYTHTGTFGSATLAVVNHYHDYYTSAKVNGKLALRPQALTWQHQTMQSWESSPGFPYGAMDASNWPTPNWDADFVDWVSMKNRAIARFTSKSRKGTASLGVTLASYGQSRDMIVDRALKLRDFWVETERDYRRRPTHRWRYDNYKQLASTVLEGFFGWAPLVLDIQASLATMTQPIPDGWLSGRAKEPILKVTKYTTGTGLNTVDQVRLMRGTAHCTLNGRVSITNPNLYLANRLGLLALPGVAWDLVPWSFVVNMFTNCAQLVGSVTDFLGIGTANMNFTQTSLVTVSDHWTYRNRYGYSHSETTHCKKSRAMESGVPAPSFKLRAPQFNLGLGAIALSLAVQKIDSIDRMMRSTSVFNGTNGKTRYVQNLID